MKKRSIVSLLLVLMMVMTSFTSAFGINGTLQHRETGALISPLDYLFNFELFNEVANDLSTYNIRVNDKFFSAEEVDSNMQQDPSLSIEDVVQELDEAEEVEEVEEVVGDLEVEVVSAINRTTVEVELAEDVDAELAADVASYTVTVGGEAVEVEEVDFDADTNVATLTVDLDGLSGEAVVNGVADENEVPALPVFESIATEPGSFEVEMTFNTPVYVTSALSTTQGTDLSVVTDGDANAFTVDAADEVADAEDTITLTVTDATAGDTVTIVGLTATGAAKVVNTWGEAAEAASNSGATAIDEVAPLFEGVRVVEGGYIIYLDFSKPIHTANNAITANVGDSTDDIRVAVNGSRVEATANVEIAAADATDEIEMQLDITDVDNLLESGDLVTVTLDSDLLDSDAGEYIIDLSGNELEGTRTKTATFEAGPGLVSAAVSDLAISDDAEQTFSITLDGELEETNALWIDVSDAHEDVRVAYNASTTVEVDHDDATVSYDNANHRFVVTATDDIEDGTTIVVTVEADTTSAVAAEDVEVTFQRRDYGTTATAEFQIDAALSALDVPKLVSGLDEQTFNGLDFTLQGALETDDSVSIDLSSLVAAGVDFSDIDLGATKDASTSAEDLDFEMSNNVLKLTATADVDGDTTVNIKFRDDESVAAFVDVAVGVTGDEYEVTFKRSDSPVVQTVKAEIEANVIDAEATNIANDTANQIQDITFTLDGELARNQFVDIKIGDRKGLTYPGDTAEFTVAGANAQVVSSGEVDGPWVIRVRANERIACGTELVVTIDGVNSVSVSNTFIEVEIERKDTDKSDTFVFEVGAYAPGISSVADGPGEGAHGGAFATVVTTADGNDDAKIRWTAVNIGAAANDTSVEIVVTGSGISIDVSGTAIEITAQDGATANEVIGAIEADIDASALVRGETTASGSGLGPVVTETNTLTGGENIVLLLTWDGNITGDDLADFALQNVNPTAASNSNNVTTLTWNDVNLDPVANDDVLTVEAGAVTGPLGKENAAISLTRGDTAVWQD